ncbi:MAG TPA: M4 family metallopeptidase [Rhodanobacteraceae bacterium]|nr:M4 family metallopeptidase [Rhodanobacteraceae bacterium]
MSLKPGLFASTAALLGIFIPIAAMGAGSATPAIARTLEMVGLHRQALHASLDDRFTAHNVAEDSDGTQHVHLTRTYKGLPVIGGDVIVHSRGDAFLSASVTQHANLSLSTQPRLGAAVAIKAALRAFAATPSSQPASTLVIYARGHGTPRLAWKIRVANAQADTTYIVDASDGSVIDRWSNLESMTASGSGQSYYYGTVALTTHVVPGGFELRDPTRGGTRTVDGSNSRTSGLVYKDADDIWGNFSQADPATVAADAQYGADMTWDFYKQTFGRLGIANNGRGAYNRVHYGTRYTNAYWSDNCFCMTYGDGDGVNTGPFVALDITGHEMTHGVTSHTAGLIYSGESGGLNEATSDIMGTMIEFFANNPKDPPDYMIGEEIALGNVPGSPNQAALRFMFHPSLDGKSPDCYYSGIADLDVHYSSAIGLHFFYLLAEGSGYKVFNGVDSTSPTCNGATVTGIGRDAATKIWYRALTRYFTSDTDYADARVATIQAASDLYGPLSVETNAVAAAWNAVNVP